MIVSFGITSRDENEGSNSDYSNMILHRQHYLVRSSSSIQLIVRHRLVSVYIRRVRAPFRYFPKFKAAG